jgi:hypothetical protein
MGSLSSLLTKKQDKNMKEDIEKQGDKEKHLPDKLPICDVIPLAILIIHYHLSLEIGII